MAGVVGWFALSVPETNEWCHERSLAAGRECARKRGVKMSCLLQATDSFVNAPCSNSNQFPALKQRVSFRQSLNYWKCKGYFESSLAFALHFTIPAGLEMNKRSAGPANGRHSQVGTCEASRTSFVRQFRLQGDSGGQRKQRSEASAIRETVPTPR